MGAVLGICGAAQVNIILMHHIIVIVLGKLWIVFEIH
jgi:hypothetical protein